MYVFILNLKLLILDFFTLFDLSDRSVFNKVSYNKNNYKKCNVPIDGMLEYGYPQKMGLKGQFLNDFKP